MIVTDRDLSAGGHAAAAIDSLPAGLPAAATGCRRGLPTGDLLDLIAVPLPEPDPRLAPGDGEPCRIEAVVRGWVSATTVPPAPVVFVPLYGCQVAWAAGRAAIVGPPDRLDQLMAAVLDFAAVEADLRAVERRAAALLETVEADVAGSLLLEEHSADRRTQVAARHLEAVALGRRLALLAPAVHAPAVHPPTLASQLGERLRERTRLVERHEFATHRAELAERVAEACGQRALEAGIARRQIGLEWTIVVLLVVQTVLLVVELLAERAAP